MEDWSIDLSADAGSEVEVSISYATDCGTGDLGVFLDDVSLNIDGLGDWAVIGAPVGSVANPNDWERVGILFEISAVVATEDTLLFGFGFEGIDTAEQRNAVMARSLAHLLG